MIKCNTLVCMAYIVCADSQRLVEERWATGQEDRSLVMMTSCLSIVRPCEQRGHAKSWSVRSDSQQPKPWRASVVSATFTNTHNCTCDLYNAWCTCTLLPAEYTFNKWLSSEYNPYFLADSWLPELSSTPFISLRRSAEMHRENCSEECFEWLPVLRAVKSNHRSHSLANSSQHLLLQKMSSKVWEGRVLSGGMSALNALCVSWHKHICMFVWDRWWSCFVCVHVRETKMLCT